MSNRDYTEIIVLCEDIAHRSFAREFLKACRVNRLRIRSRIPPGGSGEQFVQEEFVKEVRSFRKHRKTAKIALVVVTDADMLTVDARRKQLEQALAAAGLKPRQPGEEIALIIPKRNIETWVYFGSGHAVDEQSDYSKLVNIDEIKNYAQKLAKSRNVPLPADAPPSLAAACPERRRVIG